MQRGNLSFELSGNGDPIRDSPDRRRDKLPIPVGKSERRRKKEGSNEDRRTEKCHAANQGIFGASEPVS